MSLCEAELWTCARRAKCSSLQKWLHSGLPANQNESARFCVLHLGGPHLPHVFQLMLLGLVGRLQLLHPGPQLLLVGLLLEAQLATFVARLAVRRLAARSQQAHARLDGYRRNTSNAQ